MSRKLIDRLILFFGLTALAVIIYFKFLRPDSTVTEDHIARVEKEAEDAVRNYVPRPGRIDDLSVPAEDLLRGLPFVVKVERSGPEKPKGRLIHILDFHHVPKELFALDEGLGLTGAELDRAYREHLRKVDLVQMEQIALLRCLVRHHRLKKAFVEGLAEEDVKDYHERINAAKEIQDRLRRQKTELKGFTGDRREKAKALEKELDALLTEHRRSQLLPLGAIGRLVMDGELEGLALEDRGALDEAKPIRDGKVVRDEGKIKKRNEAQVKRVIERRFGLVILGGSHDLVQPLKAAGDWEYLRVTIRSYP